MAKLPDSNFSTNWKIETKKTSKLIIGDADWKPKVV